MGRETATQTGTRLHGAGLWLARLAWGLAALLALGYTGLAWFVSVRAAAPEADSLARLLQAASRLGAYRPVALAAAGVELAIGLAFFGVAGVIFWRRSEDGLAILISLMLLTLPARTSVPMYALASRGAPFDGLYLLLVDLGMGLFLSLLFLFPNGRFVPRWGPAASGIYALVALLVDGFKLPLAPELQILFLVWLAGLGLAAQLYRYTRLSGRQERQQTKWVLFGFAAFVAAFVLLAAAEVAAAQASLVLRGLSPMILLALIMGGILVLPVTIAFSVLRYRLFDIDFLINRSIVYGGLTALLGGIFCAGFFALRAVLEQLTGGQQPTAAAVASTAAVMALFGPTRRGLRRLVDRRIYGIRVDYTPARGRAGNAAPSGRDSFGPYAQLELIGKGGMGEVYQALHPTRGKPVAIKILAAGSQGDAEFHKRFEREARIAAGLKHPNIVAVYDFGQAEGLPYMVMEYLPGQDLGALLREKGRLGPDQAQPLVCGLAAALDYIHTLGLVHRDVKPANVMLNGERPVLMDFGIVKICGANTRLTQTGGMLGSLETIAPEQIRGAAAVDGRADIYSLGVIVYQMLTGEPPFQQANPGALLLAHLTQPAPDPRERAPELSGRAARAILRALEKEPEARFATAGELAQELFGEAH